MSSVPSRIRTEVYAASTRRYSNSAKETWYGCQVLILGTKDISFRLATGQTTARDPLDP